MFENREFVDLMQAALDAKAEYHRRQHCAGPKSIEFAANDYEWAADAVVNWMKENLGKTPEGGP